MYSSNVVVAAMKQNNNDIYTLVYRARNENPGTWS